MKTDKEQQIFDLARELYIYNRGNFDPKKAYEQATAFLSYTHDGMRTIGQNYYVRYTVEHTNGVYTLDNPIIHIACTNIKGFNVIRTTYKGSATMMQQFVEEKARQQIDDLLIKDNARAGLIKCNQVSSFNGDF